MKPFKKNPLFMHLCMMQWKTNKLLEIKNQYVSDLSDYYDENEARSLLSLLIRHYFELSPAELLSQADYRLSESEILSLHFAVKALKKYRPVQYIIGETAFLELRIKVNESVLIPRPETEELVQLILKNEKKANQKVIDIGTGSGCIAIFLKKQFAESEVTAIDISPEALEMAAENCRINQADVQLREMDILDRQQWDLTNTFDLIVSNPPYVRQSEKVLMQENVLQYEPHQALFVPDKNALVFYEAILDFSELHLQSKGRLYFEINEGMGNKMSALLKKKNFDKVILHKDIHEKYRFISAQKK